MENLWNEGEEEECSESLTPKFLSPSDVSAKIGYSFL